MRMNRLGLESGHVKVLALGALAVLLGACSIDGPEVDDYYEPTAHYERHPIIVTKSRAYAKRCGEWPDDMTENERNEAYANFGCAQQSNIAAMVADPEDLLRPRRMTRADAMRRSVVFDKYRQGSEISSATESKQQVQISDAVK
jgi:pilus assembly protein CpaD